MTPIQETVSVRPYGDHLDDGMLQICFTLPLTNSLRAGRAALELCALMGIEQAEIVHQQELLQGYTYFILYGRCSHRVCYDENIQEVSEIEYMTKNDVESFARSHLTDPIVVVGAGTGTDTHSVGIDSMLNLKGFHGEPGLEGYQGFVVHNLGSQVPNGQLVATARSVSADAILVSQTVTQQNLHIQNLSELVDIVEAEGMRRSTILVCGGPHLSPELAKELGYDNGFSKGTYPNHLASFLVKEVASRRKVSTSNSNGHG